MVPLAIGDQIKPPISYMSNLYGQLWTAMLAHSFRICINYIMYKTGDKILQPFAPTLHAIRSNVVVLSDYLFIGSSATEENTSW